MSPDEGLARQIEMYRKMTGEQRLKVALDLHEFACNICARAFDISTRGRQTKRSSNICGDALSWDMSSMFCSLDNCDSEVHRGRNLD